MFANRSFSLPVATLIVLLAAAEQSSAQWGPGQQGPNWANRGYSSGSSPTYVPTAPASQYVAPATTTSQSFFNAPQQDNRNVMIQMRVPAEARIWFDDSATTQTGASRLFASPPLTPGQFYVYQVRVQWNKDGEVVNQTRRVTVQAGSRINLDFTVADASEPAAPASR